MSAYLRHPSFRSHAFADLNWSKTDFTTVALPRYPPASTENKNCSMSDTYQPQFRQQSRRRGGRSVSVSSAASDAEGPSRRRRRGGQRSNLPPLGEQQTFQQQEQRQQQPQDSMAPMQPMQLEEPQSFVDRVATTSDDPQGDAKLKLRLDLNLDIAIEIRARVHGDVTLSLLT